MTDFNNFKAQLSHSLEITKNPTREFFKKNKLSGSWFMSEKYDGIRAIWTGEHLITRALRKFTWVPQWFLDSLPKSIPLDGEIIIMNEDFSHFSSLSIQKECDEAHKKWKRVVYMVFDMPIPDLTFRERRYKIIETLTKLDLNYINIVPFEYIEDLPKSFDKVNEKFQKIVSGGGEGVMLIDSNSKYAFGKRARHSLKYKKCHEGEAEVVGLCEGTGKYVGVLGKIKCKLPNNKTFYCGTGFNDEQRKSYTFSGGKLVSIKKSDDIPNIGDTITYSCMEIIRKTQIPRMSVYKGVRTDNIYSQELVSNLISK